MYLHEYIIQVNMKKAGEPGKSEVNNLLFPTRLFIHHLQVRSLIMSRLVIPYTAARIDQTDNRKQHGQYTQAN